jgi:excisionase family DNA binding protein
MTKTTVITLDPRWRERTTLTVEEAALVLGISRWGAYSLAGKPGGIPAVRLGRRLIVPVAKLREMLGENAESATAADGDAPNPLKAEHGSTGHEAYSD